MRSCHTATTGDDRNRRSVGFTTNVMTTQGKCLIRSVKSAGWDLRCFGAPAPHDYSTIPHGGPALGRRLQQASRVNLFFNRLLASDGRRHPSYGSFNSLLAPQLHELPVLMGRGEAGVHHLLGLQCDVIPRGVGFAGEGELREVAEEVGLLRVRGTVAVLGD